MNINIRPFLGIVGGSIITLNIFTILNHYLYIMNTFGLFLVYLNLCALTGMFFFASVLWGIYHLQDLVGDLAGDRTKREKKYAEEMGMAE